MRLERLEPRRLLAADPIITELMASNDDALLDEDGRSSDWIEVYNAGDMAVDLAGWSLTDSAGNLDKWQFPSTVLAPEQYLVVFASGKDRAVSGSELHTNFEMASGGEYLALARPDQSIAHEYAPQYPQQYADISYGLGGQADAAKLIDSGAEARVLVPADSSVDATWTGLGFDDASWDAGPTGVGYEATPPGYRPALLQTSVPVGTRSAYVRIPFTVDDPQSVEGLTLQMKYDDGFVAYLNGTKVAEANAPANPQYNSTAAAQNDDTDAVVFEAFDISADADLLQAGENVLAIHGLNFSSASSDMLILPELAAVSQGVLDRSIERYFGQPSPGGPNGASPDDLGPVVWDVSSAPNLPEDDQDIVVEATVTEASSLVDSVTLVYRVMYGAEVSVPMTDDGTGYDQVAADGVFTAAIPHDASTPQQMVRWYVTAADTLGNPSRWPMFNDPLGSPEYFGTVAADPSVTTELLVLEWFVQDQPATRTQTGTRASLFYDGEFYDNVFVRVRGRVSINYPKNSFKFEFNTGNHFRFSPDHPRVDEINVNTTYNDKAYIRPVLAFEALDDAGVASPSAYNLRVNQNGVFHSVAVFVEQVDRDFLRRHDLDPDGALYKFNENGSGGVRFAVAEKKTRENEGFDDLQDLVDGVHPNNANRGEYVFDNIDVAQIVNYMAAMQVIMDVDYTEKNFYMYRDTERTGLWSIIPWDKDLTFGLACSIACGDLANSDVVLADDDSTSGHFGPPAAPTHPFFGSVEYSATSSFQAPNHVMDAVINTPATREMYLRRLRSLMDELLKPAGTPQEELYFENRADELETFLGPDVLLDAARWANPWPWGADYDLAQAIDAITEDYLPRRRNHLYQNHSIDNLANNPDSAGIPHAQSGNPQIDFGPIDFNPVSGNQDEEYIRLDNPNSAAADISNWRLEGGVQHAFRPGTVIPAGGSLYVTPDVLTFLARGAGPSGGQGLFVQGNYTGHLANTGETIQLVAPDEEVVATVLTPAEPSDVQLVLRVTELHYNPPGSGDLTEFIELQNISAGGAAVTLDLSGVAITDGPSEPFVFPADTSLASGEYVLVVKNQASFLAAYPNVDPAIIVGTFAGSLSNGGETIHIDDADGGTVLDFRYEDGDDPVSEAQWHPTTDGNGYSLVIIDPLGDTDSWNTPVAWRPSLESGGSPGKNDLMLGDLQAWEAGYGMLGNATPADGDFDGDADVDGNDFLVWQINFGQAVGAAAVAEQDLILADSVSRTPAGSSPRDVGDAAMQLGSEAIATAIASLDVGADAMWEPGGRSSRSNGVSGRNAITREAAVDRLFATLAASGAIRQRVDNQEVWKSHVQMDWEPDVRQQEGRVMVLDHWARAELYGQAIESFLLRPRKRDEVEMTVDQLVSDEKLLRSVFGV